MSSVIRCPRANDITLITQRSKMECWLACYRMMYSWNNYDDDIETVVGSALEVPLPPASNSTTVENLKTSGLPGMYFPTTANALGMGPSRGNVPTSPVGFSVYLTAYKSPVWVAGKWLNTVTKNTYPHIRIVTAVDVDKERVECIDPEKAQGAICLEWEPWDWFYDGINAYQGIKGAIQFWV